MGLNGYGRSAGNGTACYDGTIEYAPAKSITAYTPGQYGILTGVFHTDIASGTCKGNVDMPVSAKPIVG